MKLLQLSCDRPSFKTLQFNPEGLTLIVGDGSSDKSKDGSSNGVGKTLSLGLIHHCLGANANSKLSAAVPDWMFRLDFSLGDKTHVVERSGNGKKLFLDGKRINVTKLREWLNEVGPFNIDTNIERISFRSLFPRFTRYYRDDCTRPLQTRKESDYDGLLRSLYLLGADCSLIISKKKNKLDLDAVKQTESNYRDDRVLKEIFRAGSKPKLRSEWLHREIERIQSDLERFQVAEDYREIELYAGELTQQLREREKQQAIIRFQIEGIDKTLAQHPDISREDLLALYQGLQSTFRPEALAHFQAVEEFHNNLYANRRQRLEQDRLTLSRELEALEEQRAAIGEERDKQFQDLQGKRALDEYAALAKSLASLEEERDRLEEYLTFSDKLQERAQKLKEKRVEEDRNAADYVRTNPIQSADERFTELAELLYPRLPSGIVLENNAGYNQIRYNLSVQIEGDDSDGINAARILCFDWILLMHGANHSMGFLWHDNRLFADMDPRTRARWFSYVMASLDGTGKQYIASLNTENYLAMSEFLAADEQARLERAEKILLRGDKPMNKLLGIQFGSGGTP